MKDLDAYRRSLYSSYASTHAGISESTPDEVLLRDVVRHIVPGPGSVLDIGCGQGALVRILRDSGHPNARGIDISPEQVLIAKSAGLSVEEGDAMEELADHPGELAAVTATDLLEHLTKDEILELMKRVQRALKSGGVMVARVPNAVSPFEGNYRHGDMTHESWFTSRSVRQLVAMTGFESVTCYPCNPVVHGVKSLGRAAIWAPFSAAFKLALVAETGIPRGHIVTQNLVFVARKVA